MENPHYQTQRTLNFAFCDRLARARLSYLLALIEEAGTEHCKSIGLNDKFMRDKGFAFLLVKLKLHIERVPLAEEEVVLSTKGYLPKRAQYMRRVDISDTKGNLLVSADCRWVLVDTESHRILRKVPEELSFPFIPDNESEDFRVSKLPEAKEIFKVRACYSNVDVNGHINNTIYADMVSDALEEKLYSGKYVRDIELFYHREISAGSVAAISLAENGDEFYIEASLPSGENAFEAHGTLM